MSRGAAVLLATVLLGSAGLAAPQAARQVKVVLEFQQKGLDSRQGVQGQGGVIIHDDEARGQGAKARGRGGVAVEDMATRTTRSEGVFTLVQDGGTASYFSPQGDGSIEFNGVATEVIVPNGRAMRISGATGGINEVTRQVLGYREQQSSSESSFTLTATVQ